MSYRIRVKCRDQQSPTPRPFESKDEADAELAKVRRLQAEGQPYSFLGLGGVLIHLGPVEWVEADYEGAPEDPGGQS